MRRCVEMNEKKILKSVGVVFIILVLAKITAFLNDAILAASIGISADADAFYMVVGIQQVLYPMLSVGIWKVFLPEYKKNLVLYGEAKADALANKMILFFTGISFAAAGLIYCFHDTIVSVCAPGLTGEVKALCGELLQLSAPLYVFIIVSAIYATMLQCHGKFFGSQIREIASHIPTIITALFLYDKFGVSALVYGLVAGSIMRLLVELPFIDWGYRFEFVKIKFESSDLAMLKKIPEALVTAGVEQVNILVDKVMASTLMAGSISALNYSQKLMNVFSGLFGNAIGTALYPQIVEFAAKKEYKKITGVLVQSIYLIGFMMIPITVGSMFFSETIIACVFQRGAFGTEATQLTATTYRFYVIGLTFAGIKTILSNMLYSFGDTKSAMRVSICTVLVNIILNITLSPFLAAKGLALATSIASIVNVVISFYFLKKYVPIPYKMVCIEIFKTLGCALLSCFIAAMCLQYIKLNNCYTDMAIAFFVCAIIYFISMYTIKSESLHTSLTYIKKMLKR